VGQRHNLDAREKEKKAFRKCIKKIEKTQPSSLITHPSLASGIATSQGRLAAVRESGAAGAEPLQVISQIFGPIL